MRLCNRVISISGFLDCANGNVNKYIKIQSIIHSKCGLLYYIISWENFTCRNNDKISYDATKTRENMNTCVPKVQHEKQL